MAAVVGIHVESLYGKRCTHLARQGDERHRRIEFVGHAGTEEPHVAARENVRYVARGDVARIRHGARWKRAEIDRILIDLFLQSIDEEQLIAVVDVVGKRGFELSAVLLLDELLDVVIAELIGKRVGVGEREPVDQRNARGIGIRHGAIVRVLGAERRHIIVCVAHRLNRIGILVPVRASAAKLGIQRGGTEIALPLGHRGHPRRQRLLVGFEALVVILEAREEEGFVAVVIEARKRQEQRAAELPAGIKVFPRRPRLAQVVVIPIVGVQDSVPGSHVSFAVKR